MDPTPLSSLSCQHLERIVVKPFHPPRIAVIIDAWPHRIDEFVKMVESIRKQKLAPIFVRVRDFDADIEVDPRLVEAIENLRYFVADVQMMSFGMHTPQEKTLGKVLDNLLGYPQWDVLVWITDEVELAPDALYRLSKPFLDPVDAPRQVKAKTRDFLIDGWWSKIWWVLRRRSIAVRAYRRDFIRDWHAEQK